MSAATINRSPEKELVVNGGESAPGSPKPRTNGQQRRGWRDDESDSEGEKAEPKSDATGGGIISQYGVDSGSDGANGSLLQQQQQNGANAPAWRSMLSCCFTGDDAGVAGQDGYQRQAMIDGAEPGSPGYRHKRTPLAVITADHPRAPPFHGSPNLPPMLVGDSGKKCLVLDLDETLVHSSFKHVPNADFVIPIDIEGRMCDCYVLKRPWVDEFLRHVCERYEVVVYTASLSKYGNPVLDLLDPAGGIRWRLFRESCSLFEGNFVKDLSTLGRPMADTIIIDNSPHSYVFQPENALPIGTYIDEPQDTELADMLPFLDSLIELDDVRSILGSGQRYG